MAKNTSKVLKRVVEYRDGSTWRTKTVSLHVSDYQDGLKLLGQSLTHEHGIGRWRYKRSQA